MNSIQEPANTSVTRPIQPDSLEEVNDFTQLNDRLPAPDQ